MEEVAVIWWLNFWSITVLVKSFISSSFQSVVVQKSRSAELSNFIPIDISRAKLDVNSLARGSYLWTWHMGPTRWNTCQGSVFIFSFIYSWATLRMSGVPLLRLYPVSLLIDPWQLQVYHDRSVAKGMCKTSQQSGYKCYNWIFDLPVYAFMSFYELKSSLIQRRYTLHKLMWW